MVEGEEGGNFGVIIDGEVEVSLKGKQLAVYGPGQVIGELAFLAPERSKRNSTVVAMVDTTYLEINAAAYALASEECQYHFKALVVSTLMRRTEEINEKLIETAPGMRTSLRDDSEFGFGLVPMGQDFGSADDSGAAAAANIYQPRGAPATAASGHRTGIPASSSMAASQEARPKAPVNPSAPKQAAMTAILFGSDGGLQLIEEKPQNGPKPRTAS